MTSNESIEQYGRRQSMHCLTLDSLVCNGYGDWLMGYTGAALGGWASPPSEFAEIRVDYPLSILDIFADPILYREYISDSLPPPAIFSRPILGARTTVMAVPTPGS